MWNPAGPQLTAQQQQILAGIQHFQMLEARQNMAFQHMHALQQRANEEHTMITGKQDLSSMSAYNMVHPLLGQGASEALLRALSDPWNLTSLRSSWQPENSQQGVCPTFANQLPGLLSVPNAAINLQQVWIMIALRCKTVSLRCVLLLAGGPRNRWAPNARPNIHPGRTRHGSW